MRVASISDSAQPSVRTRWVALLFLLVTASCSDPIGTTYKDENALAQASEWQDWVVVGSFGPAGPFTLVDTQLCPADDPCNFSHEGQAHSYDGFDGFELMVLRLEGPAQEVSHLVLRGAVKVDS